jgi:hypothetical protein
MPRRADDDVAPRPGVPSTRTLTLVGGFVLAAAATLAVFLTDNPQYLRVAVVAVAWAFVLAAFAAGRRGTDRVAAAARELELRQTYALELEREVAARHEYELELENELRRETEDSMRYELDALRGDIAALSGLRDEVARVSELRGDIAALTSLRDEVARRDEVLEPTVRALAAEGVPYVGVVYAGLVVTSDGPKVIEYNARFGDPETQVLMPRLRSDLGELCAAAADGSLGGLPAPVLEGAAVTVVIASDGYPGPYPTGVPIDGLEDAERVSGVTVFHAGTAERDGRVVTAGGRVLSVSATGETIAVARDRAYEAASRISFEGMHLRRDIAARAAREEQG